jgi:DNA-binding beta-propeller fold protein YncE
MMDDMLIEIDARKLAVARHFMLGPNAHGMPGPPGQHGGGGHHHADATCSPTWAVPAPDRSVIWVACHKSNEIVEVDARAWTLRRRLPAANGVYNIGVTHDGTRLIATNKRDSSVSVFDAKTGAELKRIRTTRAVVHGVTVSDDDRYAFISIEGSGSQPGTVDVIDLGALTKVASVDVGQQASGIDFWKSAPPRR